ncbi:MAG: hypothetical protein IT320_18955 [Anaerolineae bacterium]|nr:hypothetical protein [Anaerolineae bacterium]
MTLLLLIVSAALAACAETGAGGGGGATATPVADNATPPSRIVSAPSNGVSFGSVTLSGAQTGTFTVETVSAFALDGNLTLTLGLVGGKVLIFDMPLELMQPGTITLGDPDTAPAFASLADPSGAPHLSTSGSITFSQMGETFAANFSFEAGAQIDEGIGTPDVTVAGAVSDIRVADEAG